MHDLLGREQLRPVTDVVHGTVIIYDLVFLNSICYSSKKISLSVPFLTLKDATNSKTKEHLDRLKTEPLLALLVENLQNYAPDVFYLFSGKF